MKYKAITSVKLLVMCFVWGKRFCHYADYMSEPGVTMVTVPCRWSVPMMMSITHRGTGIGLSAGNAHTHVFTQLCTHKNCPLVSK